MVHEMIGMFTCASSSPVSPVTKGQVSHLQRLKSKTKDAWGSIHNISLLKRITALGLILIALTIAAKAAPISGDIDFGGVVTFDTLSLATATRVQTWNSSIVLQDSGDFATFVPVGTTATMAAPWIFNPSTATPSLWSVGGFTFDLSSSVVVSQSTTFLNVTGTGTIQGNGFDPTPGVWSFTSSNANGSNHSTFGFQANASAVPEGGAVALFGVGAVCLVGGNFLRRKLKAA
jgi:hypothetical protein